MPGWMRTHSKNPSDKKQAPAPKARPNYAAVRRPLSLSDLERVALSRAIAAGSVKAKTQSSRQNDSAENEADQVADRIVQMSDGHAQDTRDGSRQNAAQTGAREAPQDSSDSKTLQQAHDLLGILRADSGQRLPVSERAFFEPRFGRDLSDVRVHTGPKAEAMAESINAKAFAVGKSIVFGRNQFKPGETDGRRLIAHELAHTMQRTSGTIHRQPATAPSFRIPPELLRPRNIKSMSRSELSQFHNRLRQTLWDAYRFSLHSNISLNDGKQLSQEIAILVEVSREVALARGLTFSEADISRMRAYFVRNASVLIVSRDDCITALNSGLRTLLENDKLPTGVLEGSQIAGQDREGQPGTMDALSEAGMIEGSVVINFNNRGGLTEPKEPEHSPWDALRSLAKADVGWVVFGMSLVDGYHSVTLSMDNNNPFAPIVYWSDQVPRLNPVQHPGASGWLTYNKRQEFDRRVTEYTRTVWQESLIGGKHRRKTRLTLWRLRRP